MQTSARRLAVITRLGVRLGGRPIEPLERFERRLDLLRTTAARFIAEFETCDLWVIETDEVWFERLCQDVSSGAIARPPRGRTVVIRRGYPADLAELGASLAPTVTVRLDSDDFYLPHGLARVLEQSGGLAAGCLLDFPHGYLLDLGSGLVQRKSYAMQGPFVGATTDGFDPTLLLGDHAKLRQGAPVVVFRHPVWVQTVHGANVISGMAAESTATRARQLRRDWKRRAPGRGWSEAPRYLRQLVPVTERTRSQILPP